MGGKVEGKEKGMVGGKVEGKVGGKVGGAVKEWWKERIDRKGEEEETNRRRIK